MAAVRAEFEAREMSESDRELFRQVMTEAEVENLILPEYGYVNPRLGILADGTWWFFVLEGGPSACGAYRAV